VTDIDLHLNDIGDEGASALADALKVNTSVKTINLGCNRIGNEGAAALADALKENMSLTTIDLASNGIGDQGASVLADALTVNTSVTSINLDSNTIGNQGATALADALQVNTSVTYMDLDENFEIDEFNRASEIDESNDVIVEALVARNKRFRHLFLFDARKMLLSLMCADECGVVWPYLLKRGDTDGTAEPDNLESIRAEFEGVVAERRRRLQVAPEAKRRRVE
jgi:hypothetical protein